MTDNYNSSKLLSAITNQIVLAAQNASPSVIYQTHVPNGIRLNRMEDGDTGIVLAIAGLMFTVTLVHDKDFPLAEGPFDGAPGLLLDGSTDLSLVKVVRDLYKRLAAEVLDMVGCLFGIDSCIRLPPLLENEQGTFPIIDGTEARSTDARIIADVLLMDKATFTDLCVAYHSMLRIMRRDVTFHDMPE